MDRDNIQSPGRTDADPLRAIFEAYNPPLGDSEIFAARLSAKLEAAEYIRAYEARRKRSMRSIVVATFLVGIAIGMALMAMLMHLQTTEAGSVIQLTDYLGALGNIFGNVSLVIPQSTVEVLLISLAAAFAVTAFAYIYATRPQPTPAPIRS